MAVDPDFLMVPPCPMPWFPHVIGAAYIVARAAHVVRPITNFDRYRSRITSIIRSTTIIRPVTRVRAIISFAPYRTERGENQNEQESRPSQFNFCLMLCERCFFLRTIRNVRVHTLIIRITGSVYACLHATAQRAETTALRAKQLHDALIEHGVRDFYKSGDVRTNDEITGLSVFVGSFP